MNGVKMATRLASWLAVVFMPVAANASVVVYENWDNEFYWEIGVSQWGEEWPARFLTSRSRRPNLVSGKTEPSASGGFRIRRAMIRRFVGCEVNRTPKSRERAT